MIHRAGRVTIAQCCAAVEAYYGRTRDELLCRARRRELAWPRQMAMALARAATDASLHTIGRHFNRDHTTVVHARHAIAKRAQRREGVKVDFEGMRIALLAGAFQGVPWQSPYGCCGWDIGG